MFCNLEGRIKDFMDTQKSENCLSNIWQRWRSCFNLSAYKVHQKVNVLVDNAQFFLFFFCYFGTTVVLRFFEHVPKSSFEIKLDGATHYKFTVALRLCHFFILDSTIIRTSIYRFNVES